MLLLLLLLLWVVRARAPNWMMLEYMLVACEGAQTLDATVSEPVRGTKNTPAQGRKIQPRGEKYPRTLDCFLVYGVSGGVLFILGYAIKAGGRGSGVEGRWVDPPPTHNKIY